MGREHPLPPIQVGALAATGAEPGLVPRGSRFPLRPTYSTCTRGKALEEKEQAEYLASLCPAGEHAAQARLMGFLKDQVDAYHDHRNSLAGSGTSILSVHFASGTLSAGQAVRAVLGASSIKALDRGKKRTQAYAVASFSLLPFYTYLTFACWLTAPTPLLELTNSWASEIAWRGFISTF